VSFSSFYKGVEKKGKKRWINGKTMVQWMNLLRNSSFINKTRLPFSCEKSGAIALVLSGLTAGWLAGRQAGWQAGKLAGRQASWLADKIVLNLKFLKLYTG